jgi:hypothetical protein
MHDARSSVTATPSNGDQRRRIVRLGVVENGTSPTARKLWGEALGSALQARAIELAEQVEGTGLDALETALAGALAGAAAAGRWQTVEALARELEARRRARAGVPSLDGARARREAVKMSRCPK